MDAVDVGLRVASAVAPWVRVGGFATAGGGGAVGEVDVAWVISVWRVWVFLVVVGCGHFDEWFRLLVRLDLVALLAGGFGKADQRAGHGRVALDVGACVRGVGFARVRGLVRHPVDPVEDAVVIAAAAGAGIGGGRAAAAEEFAPSPEEDQDDDDGEDD